MATLEYKILFSIDVNFLFRSTENISNWLWIQALIMYPKTWKRTALDLCKN